MVAYSFKPRFVEPIRQGYKRHTIRAARTGRSRHARPGELIQLYTGLRTARAARIIPDPVCLEVMDITIAFNGHGEIERIAAGGHPVRDLDAFALRDGFTDAEDMARFWRAAHGMQLRFDGLLIEWAPPRKLMGVPKERRLLASSNRAGA